VTEVAARCQAIPACMPYRAWAADPDWVVTFPGVPPTAACRRRLADTKPVIAARAEVGD